MITISQLASVLYILFAVHSITTKVLIELGDNPSTTFGERIARLYESGVFFQYLILVFVATGSAFAKSKAPENQLISLFLDCVVIVFSSYQLLKDFVDFHITYTFSWRQLCVVLGVQVVVSIAHIALILR